MLILFLYLILELEVFMDILITLNDLSRYF